MNEININKEDYLAENISYETYKFFLESKKEKEMDELVENKNLTIQEKILINLERELSQLNLDQKNIIFSNNEMLKLYPNDKDVIESRAINLDIYRKNEKRIQEIKDILSNYELISEVKDDTSNEKVKVGSKVKLLDLSNNEEVTYEIVGEVEANPDNNKISNQSPLAQAILCKNVKTIVEIRNIDDPYKVKILKIKN